MFARDPYNGVLPIDGMMERATLFNPENLDLERLFPSVRLAARCSVSHFPR